VDFPGELSVKIKSKVFNRLFMGNDSLVDVEWGASALSMEEGYVS
jgi:hypothetical protein